MNPRTYFKLSKLILFLALALILALSATATIYAAKGQPVVKVMGQLQGSQQRITPHVVPPYPAKVGYPDAMAATGDSITQAFNSAGLGNIPANSWSTGTNSSVNSQYNRILAMHSVISGSNYNDAVSGSKMTNLNGEMTNVNGQNVDYVTILMGANDACTGSEATMTSVAAFAAQFQTALNTFSVGSPDSRIYVSSIPDIYHLWFIFQNNTTATTIWNNYSVCQSMLANPTSMAQADIDRRTRVRQRVIDFNTQLQQICATFVHCRFDNNAGFNYAFPTAEVSTIDYFHPNVAGQTSTATLSYNATFDFSDNIPPVSTSSVTPLAGSLQVNLSASDNVGMGGIEYRLNTATSWSPYTTTVTLSTGNTLIYRAVDLNGNIEAAHSLRVVTAVTDDGTGNTPGTFSATLSNINANDMTIYFALQSGNMVQVNGALPVVPAAVKIDGGCTGSTPQTTIAYGGIQTSGVDGLVVHGGTTLTGLKISGFPGRELLADSGMGSNHITCVVLSR